MAGDKVLVLGATGPSGICLLRELLHRGHATIAYARTPSKIPEDLASNPLLEVIQGAMEDTEALSAAIAKSKIIVSLLGPNQFSAPMPYPSYYSTIFKLMRDNGVKRILAMSTVSADVPEDKSQLLISFLVLAVRLLVPAGYRVMRDIAKVFKDEADGLDWTIYRLAFIPGGDDEASWKTDRQHTAHAGYVGDGKFKSWMKRAGLARWLVDCVEGEQTKWIGKLPAVSDLGVDKKTV
ncbi:NAD(P)-binding protein [Thozetella sp. PMI_491]|nr:NAD(P)-binding protein [Thozetella sp. PMI_491]